MKTIATLILSVSIAWTANSQVLSISPSLISNGSFENGLTGWTTAGTVEVLGPTRTSMPVGTDGTHAAAIGTFDGPNASMSQVLSLSPNAHYRMTFDLHASGVGVGGLLGQVQVRITDGSSTYFSSLFSAISPAYLHNGADGFEAKEFYFFLPANVNSVTLTFSDASPNGGRSVDPIVDNIQLQVVPEPQTLGLLLLGASIIALIRRKATTLMN
jgi:hypothetical protein